MSTHLPAKKYWILEHAKKHMEQSGGSPSEIRGKLDNEKPKRCQVFRMRSKPDATTVWADISDGQYTMRAKFMPGAVAQVKEKYDDVFEKGKHNILVLNKFHSEMARVPLGEHREGMEQSPSLCLIVEEFSWFGGEGFVTNDNIPDIILHLFDTVLPPKGVPAKRYPSFDEMEANTSIRSLPGKPNKGKQRDTNVPKTVAESHQTQKRLLNRAKNSEDYSDGCFQIAPFDLAILDKIEFGLEGRPLKQDTVLAGSPKKEEEVESQGPAPLATSSTDIRDEEEDSAVSWSGSERGRNRPLRRGGAVNLDDDDDDDDPPADDMDVDTRTSPQAFVASSPTDTPLHTSKPPMASPPAQKQDAASSPHLTGSSSFPPPSGIVLVPDSDISMSTTGSQLQSQTQTQLPSQTRPASLLRPPPLQSSPPTIPALDRDVPLASSSGRRGVDRPPKIDFHIKEEIITSVIPADEVPSSLGLVENPLVPSTNPPAQETAYTLISQAPRERHWSPPAAPLTKNSSPRPRKKVRRSADTLLDQVPVAPLPSNQPTQPGSRGSEQKRTSSSVGHTSTPQNPVSTTKSLDRVPLQVAIHDAEAWEKPSFLKRKRSAQLEGGPQTDHQKATLPDQEDPFRTRTPKVAPRSVRSEVESSGVHTHLDARPTERTEQSLSRVDTSVQSTSTPVEIRIKEEPIVVTPFPPNPAANRLLSGFEPQFDLGQHRNLLTWERIAQMGDRCQEIRRKPTNGKQVKIET